jgi:hypothetical protein
MGPKGVPDTKMDSGSAGIVRSRTQTTEFGFLFSEYAMNVEMSYFTEGTDL